MLNENIFNKLPAYIKANAELYNKIAQEYYDRTAKARTKDEYDVELSNVCNYWKRDLTDDNVIQYLMLSGVMEIDDIKAIQQYYLDNAEDFQKAILSANLKKGKRYTFVYVNEFGFPVADKITFDSVNVCQYAQFTDAVKMTFTRYKKKHLTNQYFYDCSLAIYEGWHDSIKKDTYDTMNKTANATIYRSKYACFDARFFSEMVERLGKPLFEYRALKVGKNGTVLA